MPKYAYSDNLSINLVSVPFRSGLAFPHAERDGRERMDRLIMTKINMIIFNITSVRLSNFWGSISELPGFDIRTSGVRLSNFLTSVGRENPLSDNRITVSYPQEEKSLT